jgi:hydrogenase/urease accessory protein HupE
LLHAAGIALSLLAHGARGAQVVRALGAGIALLGLVFLARAL